MPVLVTFSREVVSAVERPMLVVVIVLAVVLGTERKFASGLTYKDDWTRDIELDVDCVSSD